MDEKRWDEARGSSRQMLHLLTELGYSQTESGQRQLRQFACGCCRRAWSHLVDPKLRDAVAVAERYSDGGVAKKILVRTYRSVKSWWEFGWLLPRENRLHNAARMAIASCGSSALNAALEVINASPSPIADGYHASGRLLCDLLRCVFGNPFRKPVFPKKWRTETVTALAAGIYEGRAFDRLPILADAVEEAGCDDPAMLAHLRGDGPHCRGCWVLDLALGK